MNRAAAAAVLELDPASAGNAQVVRAAFRRLSRFAHPDQGGTAEAFQRLVDARDALLAPAPEPFEGVVRRRFTPDDLSGPVARASSSEAEIADVLRSFDDALDGLGQTLGGAASFREARAASRAARRAAAPSRPSRPGDPLGSVHHAANGADGSFVLSDLPAGAVIVFRPGGPSGSLTVELGPGSRTFVLPAPPD